MPVDKEVQKLFVAEVVDRHKDIISTRPNRLFTISSQGENVVRTHYGFHPEIPGYTSEAGRFQKRAEVGIQLGTNEPVNGFIRQYDENYFFTESARASSLRFGPKQGHLFKDAYFEYSLILQQRNFMFFLSANGNLVGFIFRAQNSNGGAYLFDLDPHRHADDLKDLNQMISLEIHDTRYGYLIDPDQDSLTISRFQNKKLLDRIKIQRPNVVNTRIMEDIIPQELLDDPLSDAPELDLWRTQNLLPYIVTDLEQHPEENQ